MVLTTKNINIIMVWDSVKGSDPSNLINRIGIKFNCYDKEIVSRTVFVDANLVNGLNDYDNIAKILLEMINDGRIS